MSSHHEQTIAELHGWYCKASGLETKLCFSQRLWHDRLRDYKYDAAALRKDCELLVRYLKREIAGTRRNIGALKLSNFLQPDIFDEDLALARSAMRKTSRTKSTEETKEHRVTVLPPNPDTKVGWTGERVAQDLRKFRESLSKGKP